MALNQEKLRLRQEAYVDNQGKEHQELLQHSNKKRLDLLLQSERLCGNQRTEILHTFLKQGLQNSKVV